MLYFSFTHFCKILGISQFTRFFAPDRPPRGFSPLPPFFSNYDGQWLLKIYWNYFYQVSAVLFQTVLDFPEVIWWTLSPWWGLSRARSLLLTAITDNQDMIGFGHPGLHISQFTITISLKPKGGRPKWPFNSRRPLQFEVIYRRHFCLLPQKKIRVCRMTVCFENSITYAPKSDDTSKIYLSNPKYLREGVKNPFTESVRKGASPPGLRNFF